jgi:DnaJ-class molecular chaperone
MLKSELEGTLERAEARITELEAQVEEQAKRLATARDCFREQKAQIAALEAPAPVESSQDEFHAAMNVEKQCGKCSGTGTYGWGAQDIATGAYEHSGQCYQCGGTGQMKKADNYRTAGYWRHRAASGC